MSNRKFAEFINCETAKTTKVYWSSVFQEFTVKLYVRGVHQKDADYHTSDRDDALGTAQAMMR